MYLHKPRGTRAPELANTAFNSYIFTAQPCVGQRNMPDVVTSNFACHRSDILLTVERHVASSGPGHCIESGDDSSPPLSKGVHIYSFNVNEGVEVKQ